ncbi:hypothetical protein BD769DRAFT_280047 [Suillus cothurnatus]|nr:hypothetical protein BD769DRAFT_280047 [Suillus cothurnatus]
MHFPVAVAKVFILPSLSLTDVLRRARHTECGSRKERKHPHKHTMQSVIIITTDNNCNIACPSYKYDPHVLHYKYVCHVYISH